jgi:hypothetical protein
MKKTTKVQDIKAYALDNKSLIQVRKFINPYKLNFECELFGGVTAAYYKELNNIKDELLHSFPKEKFDYDVLAIILFEFVCEFNSQQRTAHQISKIAPSLVKGASALPEVIEAFKKHPVNISGITFHIRESQIQYDSKTEEKIIWNLQTKKAYKDKAIKIEGFEFVSEVLKFIIEKEKQFKIISNRDLEIQKRKYKEITSVKADAKFRKKASPIILKFLRESFPKETTNYFATLGGKLNALIGIMPTHSPQKHKTKKLQNNYYRSMFIKDLQ